MNLAQLARQFDPQLETLPDLDLTAGRSVRAIREEIKEASSLTNLQLAILAKIAIDKNDFHEKVLINYALVKSLGQMAGTTWRHSG